MIRRTLDRYVIGQVVPLYLAGVAGFTLFYVIYDAFEKIDVFVDHHTPITLIALYYAVSSVYNAVLVSPIALLLAIFLVFGQMTRFNEITAMKTAGLSLYRIFLPVWIFAALISVGTWWVGDSVIPAANRQKKQIYAEKIRGRLPRTPGVKMNLNYLGPNGRIWAVRRYDARRREMQELVVQEFRERHLTRRLDAQRALWRADHWVFYDGVERHFDGNGESAAPFDSLSPAGIVETPDDLARDEAEPGQMSSGELATFVNRLGQSGRSTAKYETERHLKFAYPLVNFMVALLAVPMATRLRKGGIALGFALSVALFTTYIGLVRFGQVLGHNGEVPPMLAAWMGNILFGAAGLILLIRTPK